MGVPQVQLLLNKEEHGHGAAMAALLTEGKQLECMIAFAKMSGYKGILDELQESLARGLKARFAVGLDFYQTDPELLRRLLKLERKYSVELYLCVSDSTFHPKIYAVSYGKDCTVLVGSANLTNGGFWNNYEASAKVDDPTGAFFQSVRDHIDQLIEAKELVRASHGLIDDYERRHLINKAQQLLAKRRTEKAFKRAETQNDTDTAILNEILQEMREDLSDHGFDANRVLRGNNRERAARKIIGIATLRDLDHETFVGHYVELISSFHSGGLHRGKNIIADNAEHFRAALAEVTGADHLTPGDAYELLLRHFHRIPRAGVNVITEILHAMDNRRYAILNQNAVSGMRLAGVYEFPLHPTKATVTGEVYARFCQQADLVRRNLELADFTELDALFNYAYWRYEEAEVADAEGEE